MDISKQEENFIRVSLMIMNVVASQLRAFFTQAWNSLHGGAVWRNDPASGKRFITEMKKKKGQIKDKTTGKKLKEGNTSKWDCTILFAALLYSNVFTKDPAKDPAFALIDRLRGLRNDWFAHLPMAEMTDVDFCILVEQLKVTFVQLSWDENEITRISKDQLKTDDFKSLETDMQSFIKDKDTLLKELNEEKTLNESLVVKVQELMERLKLSKELSIEEHIAKHRRDIQMMLSGWKMRGINSSKEFVLYERDRATFMADLILVDINDFKEKLCVVNELSDFMERRSRAEENSISFEHIITEKSQFCFVKGVAAIGKTSLTEHLTLSFANGNDHYRNLFDFVFLIKCRELEAFCYETLNADFQREFGICPSRISSGERVLLIIEGLDEVLDLDKSLSHHRTVLSYLIKTFHGFIPGHSTIVTGRPHVESILHKHDILTNKTRVIEVIGLSTSSIKSYISAFANGDNDLEKRISDFVHESSHFAALATIPQYLNSLCCILAIEQDGIKIEKKTSLYVYIFVSFLRDHMKELKKTPEEILEDEKVGNFLVVISNICFDLLKKGRVTFRKGEFKLFHSSMESNQELHAMLLSFIEQRGNLYQFLHLTLHQFFAAVHCFINNLDIDDLLRMKAFEIIDFYAGLKAAEERQGTLTGDAENHASGQESHPDIVRSFVQNIKVNNNLFGRRISRNKIARSVLENFRKNNHVFKEPLLSTFHELFYVDDKLPSGLKFKEAVMNFNPLTSLGCIQLVHFLKLISKNRNEELLSKIELNVVAANLLDTEENRELFAFLLRLKIVRFSRCCIARDLLFVMRNQLERIGSSMLTELRLDYCRLQTDDWVSLKSIVPHVPLFYLSDDNLSLRSSEEIISEIIRLRQTYMNMKLHVLKFETVTLESGVRERFDELNSNDMLVSWCCCRTVQNN